MPLWFWLVSMGVLLFFAWFSWWGRTPHFAKIDDLATLETRLRQLSTYGTPDSTMVLQTRKSDVVAMCYQSGPGSFRIEFPTAAWSPDQWTRVVEQLRSDRSDVESIPTGAQVRLQATSVQQAVVAISTVMEGIGRPILPGVFRAAIEGPYDLSREHRDFMTRARATK